MSRPILGVDLGKVRIGLAVGDTELGTSNALRVIRRTDDKTDARSIADLIREYGGNRVVLGLPLNMDGSEGESAAYARHFAEALIAAGCEVVFQDERLTTCEAKELMREAGVSEKKGREKIDMFAAAAILRSYLAKTKC